MKIVILLIVNNNPHSDMVHAKNILWSLFIFVIFTSDIDLWKLFIFLFYIVLCFSGAYVPLTEEGNIMVNGVLASCYASFDHNLAHVVMAPLQWFPEMMQLIFGEQNGSPVFVDIVKYLGKLAVPFSYLKI